MIVEDSGAVTERLRIEKDPLAEASRVFPKGSIDASVHRSTPILDRLRDHQPACYPADPQLKMPLKMRLPTWAR